MHIGSRLFAYFNGSQVGSDAAGNRYFIARRAATPGTRPRRWVLYAGASEASSLPPAWQAWLRFSPGPQPADGPARAP